MAGGERNRVVVVGSGTLTLTVSACLQDGGRGVLVLDVPEVSTFSIRDRALERGLEVITLPKSQTADFLLSSCHAQGESGKPPMAGAPHEAVDGAPALLVMSVENLYVFPRRVVECPGIEIVNYHNSLLPRHRGMNAEAWAIFEGDHQAGYSWHRVAPSIDTGAVLWQEAVDVRPTTTSLGLLGSCSKKAARSFPRFFEAFETGELQALPQPAETLATPAHRTRDLPGGGVLDLAWGLPRMSAFVRAFDYGKLESLGRPTVCLEDAAYAWTSWRIEGDIPLPDQSGPGSTEIPVRASADLDGGVLRLEQPGMGVLVLGGLARVG